MAPRQRNNSNPNKKRAAHVPKQRTRKRNQKKRSRGFLTEMSLLRNKQKAQRYPYHEGPQVGDSYKRNAYLYFAPNVPQRLFDDVMGDSSGSGKSKSKESWDDILETSKKFEEKQKKRKKEAPPSVKEVREHLRHMVNFSTSHYEKEFKKHKLQSTQRASPPIYLQLNKHLKAKSYKQRKDDINHHPNPTQMETIDPKVRHRYSGRRSKQECDECSTGNKNIHLSLNEKSLDSRLNTPQRFDPLLHSSRARQTKIMTVLLNKRNLCSQCKIMALMTLTNLQIFFTAALRHFTTFSYSTCIGIGVGEDERFGVQI